MSIAKYRRPSAWLALLGLAAALGLHALPAKAAVPALVAGTWTITGSDVAGIDWTASKLSFESQVAGKNGYEVSGYFDWTGSNGAYGREKVAGTLFDNRHLAITGYLPVPPSFGIVTNVTYNADVSADGWHIVNGTWGGNGIPSDAWTAVQSVPEPSAVTLLLAGILLIGMVARRCGRE